MSHRKRRREAPRIPGHGFVARVRDYDATVAVLNLSRRGIALESDRELPAATPIRLEIDGPAGSDVVDVFLVRSEPIESSDGERYLCAGLFTRKLARLDLPKVVHEDF